MMKQILSSGKPQQLIKFRRRTDRDFSWGISLCDDIDGLDITEFLPEYLRDEG